MLISREKLVALRALTFLREFLASVLLPRDQVSFYCGGDASMADGTEILGQDKFIESAEFFFSLLLKLYTV